MVAEIDQNLRKDPWPDNTPTVSMDVSLGRTYDYIDVNPASINALLEKYGVAEESRSELRVLIQDRCRYEGQKGLINNFRHSIRQITDGRYMPTRKQANVNVGRSSKDESINESFAHEATHFKQHQRGKNIVLEQLFVNSLYQIKYIGAIAVPQLVAGAETGNRFVGPTLLVTGGLSALGGYFGGNIKGYSSRLNKSEREAERAEKTLVADLGELELPISTFPKPEEELHVDDEDQQLAA